MRYLYTGWLPDFGTCEARRRGLVETGREVVTLSFAPFFDNSRLSRWFGPRVNVLQALVGFGPGIWKYNRHLLELARRCRPDIVWIDKGHFVSRATLRAIRKATGAFFVCYNTDDIRYARHGWRLHIPAVPEYDVYFITNRFNVDDLRALGARRVSLTHLGYDRDVFRPLPVTAADGQRLGASAGFIGHWERATERLLLEAFELGLAVRVRGHRWGKAVEAQRFGMAIEPGLCTGETYVKAMIATRINLGINSVVNRNLSSGRTFEIPAVGGFLLAQRTVEHQAFYEEGKEAEFFDSAAELVDKARYYLAHDSARREIAERGHRRCTTSGYSWQERMRVLVKEVEETYHARKDRAWR